MKEEKKEKIGVLYIGMIYPTINGAAVAAKNFVEGLEGDADVDLHFINTSFNKDMKTLEKFSFLKIFKLIFYVIKLVRLLIFCKIDKVVIMHSLIWSSFLKDSIFIRICSLFRKEILLYAQGIGFDTIFYDNLSDFRKKYVDKTLKCVSGIVLVSESMRSEYKRWIKEDKMYKIYNVGKEILDKNETRVYNTDTVKILLVSFISRAKGVFVLLDAFKKLYCIYPNLRLIVCGSFMSLLQKDKEDFFAFIKENNLEEIIEYKGVVSGEEKKKVFLEADIFTLPTLRESFGIVNIEAMSAGLPVVSTYQGAIPEYIIEGENGFLAESGNVEQLKEKLEILIKDRGLRIQIGEDNRNKFFELFTRERFIENWKRILLN